MLYAARMLLMGGTPSWVLPGASIDFNFANSLYWGGDPSGLTVTRATTNATDLLLSSASGYSYKTYGAATPRLSSAAGGLIVEEARTQLLAAPTVPATQTTASLGTGTYALWVNGSGTATPSGNTATITGAAAASNGAPNIFTVTVAGSVDVIVSGALNAFQLEAGTWGTSFITTATARNADVVKLTTPPVFGTAYSLFGSGVPMAPVTFATAQFLAIIDDGSVNNRFFLTRALTTAFPNGGVLSGGVGSTVAVVASAWAQNTSGKLIGTTIPGSQVYAFGGTSATSANAALPVSPTNLRIGCSQGSTQFFNGVISRIAFFPAFLSTAQLRSMTS